VKLGAGFLGVQAGAQVAAIALREIVTGAAEVEQELDVLNVVLDATDQQMARISDTAQQLGADVTLPGISAGDAAVAMNELAKAGLNVEDTIGGAKGVLQLATAGQLDVRDAAALAGGALNAFCLEGERAADVADLLAGASIAAQGDVSDMGLALQQVGAVARQSGLSIEQTVGAIGLLAKNGILGSDAGTSLRTTLLKLIPTTKEAKEFTEALGISIDENKTLGEQLPDVIEQYRTSLSKLSPALQNVALTQIFGSDAIRAASIFAREGAEGYNQMVEAVNRTGAANELATARTQGLIGQFESLKSQLSTLAIEFGELTNPIITSFLSELAEGVGIVISFTQAAKDLGESIADINVPGTGTDVGGVVKEAGEQFAKNTIFALRLKDAYEAVEGQFRDTSDAAGDLRQEMIDAGKFKGSPDVIDRNQAVADARVAGKEVGNQFASSVAQGIQSEGEIAVASARALAQRVAEQGRAAVAAAIAGAQQNLTSIGSQLAADAGAIIDATVEQGVSSVSSGGGSAVSAGQRARQQKAIKRAQAELDLAIKNIPIMREIERLQQQLDRESQADQATDVRRGLRDAREELALAQRQAQTAGQLDPRQQAARAKFLRPFKEEVADAQKEVRRFNTEAKLDKLQSRLDKQTDEITENIDRLRESVASAREALIASQQSFSTGGLTQSLKSAGQAQKEAVTRGINDAIDAFNRGQIELPELNRRIAKTLEDNGVDYENAGKVLGTAFVNGFQDKLKGLGAQADAITGGPQDPGAGSRPQIVVPAAVARTARLNNEEAQRRLTESLVSLGTEQASDIRRIRVALEGPRSGRPTTSVGDSAADKANTAAQAGPVGAPRTKPKPRTRYKDPPEN